MGGGGGGEAGTARAGAVDRIPPAGGAFEGGELLQLSAGGPGAPHDPPQPPGPVTGPAVQAGDLGDVPAVLHGAVLVHGGLPGTGRQPGDRPLISCIGDGSAGGEQQRAAPPREAPDQRPAAIPAPGPPEDRLPHPRAHTVPTPPPPP